MLGERRRTIITKRKALQQTQLNSATKSKSSILDGKILELMRDIRETKAKYDTRSASAQKSTVTPHKQIKLAQEIKRIRSARSISVRSRSSVDMLERQQSRVLGRRASQTLDAQSDTSSLHLS